MGREGGEGGDVRRCVARAPLSSQYFLSKDVRLPVQLQRAMAAEAEAAREARAKVRGLRTQNKDFLFSLFQVIAAEGEQKASRFVDDSDPRISLLLK